MLTENLYPVFGSWLDAPIGRALEDQKHCYPDPVIPLTEQNFSLTRMCNTIANSILDEPLYQQNYIPSSTYHFCKDPS